MLLKSQQVLEQNEDMMAAIVENMQLGRLDDCMKQYMVLHKNLIALAHDLDNYPALDSDPFQSVYEFPDGILRRDILDDFRAPGSVILAEAPLPPPCSACSKEKLSSHECREVRQHVEPNSRFSETEVEEFIHATNVLSDRHRNYVIERMTGKSKRPYKRWNSSEKYTLMVAISILGPRETHKIAELMEDRTENQIRSFISHNFEKESLMNIVQGVLPPPPPRYQPPPKMVLLFADPKNRKSSKHQLNWSALAPTSACEPGGWNTLLCIAAGLPQTFPHYRQPKGPGGSDLPNHLPFPGPNCDTTGTTPTVIFSDHLDAAAEEQGGDKQLLPPWLVIANEDHSVIESMGSRSQGHGEGQASPALRELLPETTLDEVAAMALRPGTRDEGIAYPDDSMEMEYGRDGACSNRLETTPEDDAGASRRRSKAEQVLSIPYGALHSLVSNTAGGKEEGWSSSGTIAAAIAAGGVSEAQGIASKIDRNAWLSGRPTPRVKPKRGADHNTHRYLDASEADLSSKVALSTASAEKSKRPKKASDSVDRGSGSQRETAHVHYSPSNGAVSAQVPVGDAVEAECLFDLHRNRSKAPTPSRGNSSAPASKRGARAKTNTSASPADQQEPQSQPKKKRAKGKKAARAEADMDLEHSNFASVLHNEHSLSFFPGVFHNSDFSFDVAPDYPEGGEGRNSYYITTQDQTSMTGFDDGGNSLFGSGTMFDGLDYPGASHLDSNFAHSRS